MRKINFTNRRFWPARLVVCGITLICYFFILRPIRIAATKYVVSPQLASLEKSTKFQSNFDNGSILLKYKFDGKMHEQSYRPRFGFFFLLSTLALFFVTFHPQPYLVLWGFHLLASFLTLVLLFAGATGFSLGFILADIIDRYLVPAFSLGLVPLAMNSEATS